MTELFDTPEGENKYMRGLVEEKTFNNGIQMEPNGLECPECRNPLSDTTPQWTWMDTGTHSKAVGCPVCGWDGRRTCEEVRVPLSEVTDLGMLRGSVGEMWSMLVEAIQMLKELEIGSGIDFQDGRGHQLLENKLKALGWKVDDDGLHLIEWR